MAISWWDGMVPAIRAERALDEADHYRRRAAYYARALRNISAATALPADRLREIAEEVLKRKPLKPIR